MTGGLHFGDRYLLLDRLDCSQGPETWRATDELLDRGAAVKIFWPEWCGTDAMIPRVQARLPRVMGLAHRGIASTYDHGEARVMVDHDTWVPEWSQDGVPVMYVVTELVAGLSLADMLARRGRLAAEETLELSAQAARALHAAHQRGVIHENVRPGNVLVTAQGQVKVTDFAAPSRTAHYLAPELARGQDPSPRSDVYALGVVVYQCLTGHPPFESDNCVLVATAHLNQEPPSLPATIDPDIVAVVAVAMEKDPEYRFQSAEAFAKALEKLLARDPSALDDIPPKPANRCSGRHDAPPANPMMSPPGSTVRGAPDVTSATDQAAPPRQRALLRRRLRTWLARQFWS
ncbi:MAG: serine/threonine-protein kinase [Kineosporiaceae bacterium]